MTYRPSSALDRAVVRALAGALVLVLVACSSSDRDRKDGPAAAPAVAPPDAVHAFVAHRDARFDSPSFVWLAKNENVQFASAREAASTTLQSIAGTFALERTALASIETTSIDDLGRGAIIARTKQRVGGIEVFRGGLAIAMTRAFEPVSASGFLARSISGAARPFARSPIDAVNDAHRALVGQPATFTSIEVDGDYEHFTTGGLAAPARVKKVLFPMEPAAGGGVVPAYYVELQIKHGPAFSYVVSAGDGTVLFKNDLVRYDAFSYRAYADPTTKIPWDGPQGNGVAPHLTGKPDGFKPTWQPSSLVTLQNYPFSRNDAWLAPGATALSGNNVVAYPDIVSPDGLGGDALPTATGPNAFDYTFDTTQSPGATPTNISAASTHLFYVTNFLHDWYYDLGFAEKDGNHQQGNFGRGGREKDPLKAEAQDFSGKNNANATVPADGASPRLQMYVFSGPSIAELTVLTPAALAGQKPVGLAGFGKDQFDTTGTLALAADDQGADVADGCEPLTKDVTGKIVLVHRGLCSFIQKTLNVQQAGGIAALITNVPASATPTEPPFMGGTDTTSSVTIPSLSVALADGQALEAAIADGVTVNMKRLLQTDLDGAIDTTIVAHEWGHVISGRLIHDGQGLTTNQSGGLGEGWADFSALLLMVRADDVLSPNGAGWAGAYPNGAYATSGAGADFYFGIRRVPYSIDFTKDPLTLKHIANGTALPTGVPISFGEDGSFNAEVHSTGEVWATMLWECYAALLRDPRHADFVEAQRTMKQYYVSSLKLTPPDPTLLEARDAVLAAAFAANQDDYLLFWAAFGRRGAGVGALGPAKDSTTNQGVVESFYVGNDAQVIAAPLKDDALSCDHDDILDDGEIGTIALTVRNSGTGTLAAAIAKLSSKTAGVTFPDGDTVAFKPLKPFASSSVKLHVQIHGAKPIDPIAIDVEVTDPSFPEGRVARTVIPARYEADEAANTSTVDHVDTKKSAWVATGDDAMMMALPWARAGVTSDGYWSVPNNTVSSEQQLTSPKFTLEGSTFELAFRHRWSFRISRQGNSDLDGGVVEVSVDGGKTWRDLSEVGTIDYTTTLATGRGDSTLEGRRAYGNKSPGYPDQWVSSRIKIDLGAHPESVQVRFRTASGSRFAGAPGWDVDDIELDGISSKPFWSFIAHADNCDPNGPTASAGNPVTVKSKARGVTLTGSGTHPKAQPLEFVWTQVAGPTVPLATDLTEVATFDAPDVGRETVTLTFQIRADDGRLLSPAARVDVTVVPGDPVPYFAAEGAGCSTSRRAPPRSAFTPVAFTATGLALLGLGILLRRRSRRR
ncbi:MAG: hypothetical protein QOI41_6890 [Myxococcales bacterium]|nr:hypothetical protein [Myxococcales bacterium]